MIKITRLEISGIKIPNPKIINQLLKAKELNGFNSVSVPYVINSDLTVLKEHESKADTKHYMSDVRSLRFKADATHPGISHIVSVLGGHLHDPSKRHVNTLKRIYRCFLSRKDDGPVYDKKRFTRVHLLH